MNFYSLITYTAAFFCGGLAVFVLFKDRRSFNHRIFAVGMIVLALEAVFRGLSLRAFLPEEIIRWQRAGFYAAAFLLGIWLVFSLSFLRAGYKEYLIKWRWVILATFLFPLALVTLFEKSLFKGNPIWETSSQWLLPLGWSGNLFHILFLMTAVLILANFESTLRASSGVIRWQIKFTVLGVACLFAVRIFTNSQVLLFQAINSSMELFNSIVIILANTLIVLSLTRSRFLSVDIYLSETILYRSFTVLIAGIYLVVVGILAKIVSYFNGRHPFFIEALFVFLALLGLIIILLSNQLRQQIRRFVRIHFQRPQYDYRKAWAMFTQRTSSLMDIPDLCATVAKMLSETFGVPSVTLWLVNETNRSLEFGGSTAFSKAQTQSFKITGKGGDELVQLMRNQKTMVDFDWSKIDWVDKFKQSNPDLFREAQIRYSIPLVAGEELLGVMTLSEKLLKEPFSLEDIDLVKMIADQAAGNLLNLILSKHLQEIKQMEAFQTMSAFMIHDLKNLASTLTLTVQNLPIHFDNPDFRDDALRIIGQSVTKVNSMCNHLSMLSKKIELKKVETDVNKLISTCLTCLNGSTKVSLIQDLNPVPKLMIDPEQVHKVLTNLILNANEAVGNGGEVRLATEQRDGWAILSVSDNGCGMSREFMERSLFHPFKTTKKQGMGIGLFHSKMIVEAHRGRIEVESEEGKGSTFKVFLPIL